MKIIALLLLFVTGVANAQGIGNPEDDERAREFFISGKSLYQEGRYRDALVAFETAYRKSSRPAILRSIAYCHEKLGEFERLNFKAKIKMLNHLLNQLYEEKNLAKEGNFELKKHLDILACHTMVIFPLLFWHLQAHE